MRTPENVYAHAEKGCCKGEFPMLYPPDLRVYSFFLKNV